MKLSIITINYNNREGLRRTIDSVLAQTWKDYEWIVVDGGSTDGSKEVIEKYAAQGCFAWWCSEKDKGVYNAMNKGIEHAKGEYLNFMNSGDKFHENSTLEQVFLSKELVGEIIYGDYKLRADGKCDEDRIQPQVLDLRYLFHHSINHQSCIIKRYLFEQNPYNEQLQIASDRLWFIQEMLLGKSFYHMDCFVDDFFLGGISSDDVKLGEEKMIIRNEYLPPGVASLIEQLDKYELAAQWNPEVVSCYRLIHSRRLYKRIISIVLRLLSYLEK